MASFEENLLTLEGVSTEDSLKEIRKQWRRLTLKYHPDKNINENDDAKTPRRTTIFSCS